MKQEFIFTSANEIGRRLCIHPCLFVCVCACLLAGLLELLLMKYDGEVAHDQGIIALNCCGDPDRHSGIWIRNMNVLKSVIAR